MLPEPPRPNPARAPDAGDRRALLPRLTTRVMEPAGSAAREWAERICDAAGFRPNVRFESPDMLVHERLVRPGHAGAFLPDLFWVDRLPAVRLRPLPDNGYRDIICSVRAGTSNHPSVTAATNALQAACSEADEAITAHLATAKYERRSSHRSLTDDRLTRTGERRPRREWQTRRSGGHGQRAGLTGHLRVSETCLRRCSLDSRSGARRRGVSPSSQPLTPVGSSCRVYCR